MEVTMKRGELLELHASLQRVSGFKGRNFAYAVAKNRKFVKREIDEMQLLLDPSPEYQKYDEERIELCKQFADKDDKGEPMLEPNAQGQPTFVGLDPNPEFQEKVDELKEKYSDAMNERDEKVKEYRELLEKDGTFNLYAIRLSQIPDEITGEQLTGIMILIEDDSIEASPDVQ